MLRRESAKPGERIFIDNNSFRHTWTGFEDKIKSLRKTDIKHVSESFETISVDTPEADVISTDDNKTTVENTTNSSNNNEENENNNQEEVNDIDDNKTAQNSTEDATETPESKETTLDELILGALDNNSTKISIEPSLRQGKEAKTKKAAAATKKPAATTKNKIPVTTKTAKTRTVATTTFFCPFFGVITMSAFID